MIEDDGDLAPGFQHSSLGMVHSNGSFGKGDMHAASLKSFNGASGFLT
jgi:hypothetical protein